mgnify:CR=1 FL=1
MGFLFWVFSFQYGTYLTNNLAVVPWRNERNIVMIHTIKLPNHLRRFPEERVVVGGEARVAAYCLVHRQEWPASYTPRDLDYLRIATPEEADGNVGILRNEVTTCGEGKHVDSMVVSSIEDWLLGLDTITNGVWVENNSVLKMTGEALLCYVKNEIRLNFQNPKLKGGGFWEYLALRACVQAGYDVRTLTTHHRHGACKLHASIWKPLNYERLVRHWYWPKYCSKMEQVKTGKH